MIELDTCKSNLILMILYITHYNFHCTLHKQLRSTRKVRALVSIKNHSLHGVHVFLLYSRKILMYPKIYKYYV